MADQTTPFTDPMLAAQTRQYPNAVSGEGRKATGATRLETVIDSMNIVPLGIDKPAPGTDFGRPPTPQEPEE